MNERLRSVLVQRGLTAEVLAELCSVDPKTVVRWMAGRVPHRRHRRAVARHLQVEESKLWPIVDRTVPAPPRDNAMIADAYPDRASAPRELWLSLLRDSQVRIDVLVFSGTILAQTNPRITQMLGERADAGTQVRLCFGDPQGDAVARRGREEGIGDALAAKIRASLTYFRPLVARPGCEVRLHDTTLYCSLFRYDDHLLVNPHVWGRPASANPTFRLTRCAAGWFDQYVESFDAIWDTASPWDPENEERSANG